MLGSSGLPTFPIDVVSGQGIDVTRQGTTFRFDLNDGTIRTGGTGDIFTVATALGNAILRAGFSLSIVANRNLIGEAFLRVDATASKPWLDVEGKPVARVIAGRIYRINYDPLLDGFRYTAPVLIENDDFAEPPEDTLKGSLGDGVVDLTVDEARELLHVDHLPNKSESEMVSDGPISVAFANLATALATKATPADITAALLPVNLEIAKKATPAEIDAKLAPVVSNVSTLQTSSATQSAQITALQTGQKSDRITRGAYADFAGMTLVADATYEVLDRDTGTHPGIASEDGYNPDTGRVPNAGIFIPKKSPLVLRQIGGTSAGAVPGLVADRDTLLATRQVMRPGENPRGWTTNVAAAPSAASPLALGGAFSTGAAVGGRSLRMAGSAQVGPIAANWIQPGAIYDAEILVSRTVLDASENRVLPRIRALGLDQVELPGGEGVIALPAVTLATVDELVSIKTSISTVPGAAALTFPRATGGYARVYLSAAGATNGEVAISELSIGRQVKSVLDALKSAPVDLNLASTDRLAKIDANGTVLSITPVSSLIALIESIAMPATYAFPASMTVGTDPVVVVDDILDDNVLVEVSGQNISSSGRLAIAAGGATPSFDTPGSNIILPGQPFTLTRPVPGRVKIIADSAGVKATLNFATAKDRNSNAAMATDRHMARYSANLSAAQRSGLRDLYGGLFSDRLIGKAIRFWMGCAPSVSSIRFDWADATRLFAMNSAPATNWLGTTFDGVDDYFDMGGNVASLAGATSHTLAVWTDTTVQTAGRQAAGDRNVRIGPNRTNTTTTGTDYGGATSVVTGGLGGLQCITRRNADTWPAATPARRSSSARRSARSTRRTPSSAPSRAPLRLRISTRASCRWSRCSRP